MDSLLYIPMQKIDEERRLVIGRAVQEVPDRSGEVLDYDKSKPHIQAWSDDCFKRTAGKSKGNLREQHRKDMVAGHLVDLKFDDQNRSVEVVAKVTDDNTWRKVMAGSLSGFSIGGRYGDRELDKATGLTRYTALPSELSIVDAPCIPTCTVVEVLKADGSTESLQLNLPSELQRTILAKSATASDPEEQEFVRTMALVLAKGY